MIVRDHLALSLSRQCRLLSVGRSSLYYEPKGESAETLALMRRIDELFLKYPFYGARRMALHLRREGVRIGRRRAGRLMRLMGLEAIYRAPRTSAPHPERRIYPYLLRGLAIERPNHVWCADITFYEATVVKRESGYVSGTTPVLPRSSGPELRIARLGTFLSSGARRVARTLLLSGRFPAPRRIRAPSRMLRAQRSGRWDPSTSRRLSAQVMFGHTSARPSADHIRPDWIGRSRVDQAQRAPIGTRPVSENRHSAMSSLRASATIITRRIRPRAPAVRSSNHLQSALSGW